jgi:hypothetical protein
MNILEENKKTFCDILRGVKRENANIEGLINKLNSSDFFTAPASTKYHNSYEGGLCDHSLNVYYNLKSLVKNKHLEDKIPEDSIIICGLLHDMSKMNVYEKFIKNEKVYDEYGSKHDNMGNFDWVAKSSYKMVDTKDRFLYGNHEETAEYMVRTYIPLKLEESVAILNHHGSTNYDSIPMETVSPKFERYPLACLLHVADMISMYVDERSYE